ncbi:terpene synthase family protein [Nocardia brasiliensis]|uniref:terpene synthase family protein n=1 Tax=Nocardia brasiliensis TaxID=37326 RepID=UPI0024587DE8|nr:hypothetical protein [Nocardia brasiliensis]
MSGKDMLHTASHPVLALIRCPIPPVIPDRAAQLEEDTLNWFARFGFGASPHERQLLQACAPAHCACMTAPRASEDLLKFCSTYLLWVQVVDPFLDHGELSQRKDNYARLAPSIIQVLREPWSEPLDLDPKVQLLRDLRLYLEGKASPEHIRHWVDAHSAYLAAVACEILDAERQRLPSLDQFLHLRNYSAGGPTGAALVSLCNGASPDSTESEAPAIHAVADAAVTAMAFLGDLGSAGKESPLEYNLVNVLDQQLACSREEAMAEAIHLCNSIIDMFLKLRSQLLPTASISTRAYLEGLGTLLRGTLDWAALAPRYARLPDALPKLGNRPRIDTRRLPSISWWWDLLDSAP